MATSKDVLAFRTAYTEFDMFSDPDIAGAFDDADVWLEAGTWPSQRDFALARYLWVAHNLAIWAQLKASIESTGSALMGFTGTFTRMISFGERRVMFERKVPASAKNLKLSPGDAALLETFYGTQFYALRQRNIMPIMTV